MSTFMSGEIMLDTFMTLKFNGRSPRTLTEFHIAKANEEHSRRLAEIKKMGKKLDLLQEHLPALRAAGVQIDWRGVSSYDGGKTLHLERPLMSRDDKLYQELLKIGFKEIDRRDWGAHADVTLKHGRSLLIRIEISKPAADAKPARSEGLESSVPA